MNLQRSLPFALCVLFLLGIALACYRRPVPDDFDRYIYEAIVRGKSQPIETVYAIVKHENPRAEASSVLDSPEHLRELEALYAVRPLYLEAISIVSRVLPFQSAINLISATSLLGIGIVVLIWTKRPLETGLLMAAYPILALGRLGTPDALAAFLSILALWLIEQEKSVLFGLALLFLALGVRTDSLLLLLAVLAWFVWGKRISLPVAGLLALLAMVIVVQINRWAGNYGWIVLFRLSFIGGRFPSQIPHTLSVREYLSALIRGAAVIFSHVSIWILLGLLAWIRRPTPLLVVAGGAVLAHFLLYPSPEDRYLIWAYIVAGAALIRTFDKSIVESANFPHARVG